MRRTSGLIAAAVLVSTLAACGAADERSGCTPFVPQGDASRAVNVEGDVGSQPTVTFPTPLVTEAGQATEVVRGDGEVISRGEVADAQVSLYNGEDGQLLTATGYQENPEVILRRTASADDSLGKALACTAVGSRVVYTTTVEEVYGPDNPQIPLENNATIVAVFDVEDAFPGRANGAPQLGQNGMPAVVLAPNGRPGISVPAEEPPTDLRVAVLRQGNGPEVEQGDRVVLHYTGLTWDDEQIFDSSWEAGVPATFTAVSFEDDPAGIVPGLAEALIGQNVGSQVIAVIPPEQGYPEGQRPAAIPEGSTMVFVFDVLGIDQSPVE
ncbi:FKBP-type peptidyl-prolyl cis-trans isomerase [Lysobacter korlensis]|uniref:peptidylprolyl isomerase n=1 Tax=Lysobacter korlensis TaxID=553636 RepID=A0ABV6RWU7_9GAMM